MDRLNTCIGKGVVRIAVICFMVMVIGCSDSDDNSRVTNEIKEQPDISTKKFTNDTVLVTYLKEQYAKSVYPDYNNITEDVVNSEPAPADGAASRSNDDFGESGSDAHSGTNLQEDGVDESDKVKTDGIFFYIANRRSFHVLDATGDMAVMATQAVQGYVDALYLYDNKLVVLYTCAKETDYSRNLTPIPDDSLETPYWIPPKKIQGVSIYDVSDPRHPTDMKTVEFDGHLVSSRRIGGRLHIVQQFMPELPKLEYWYDGTKEDKNNKIKTNKEALDKITLDQLIPYYRVVNGSEEARQEGPTVSTQDFYCPVSIDSGGIVTTIVTFDLDDAALPFKSMGMVADGHIVYASTKALYIANHHFSITENAVDEVTSESAMIYKFDLTGETVRFAGGKILPGWILNQFSLGEHKGVLRVAMTTGHSNTWGPTSKNNVYCLQSTNDGLKVIGELKNLAPGEDIYAARFMGDRGYLVTFKKVDPLFTLDLSDPTQPKEVGKLKIPGYSDYIHPYADNHLITVGKHAVPAEEGDFAWFQGVQLSIFDVSDFSNPVLLHKELIGDRGTETESSQNHKAFTFWADKELLAIPVDLTEHQSTPQFPNRRAPMTFKGLYVYRVSTENGFEHLGRISTTQDIGLIRSLDYDTSWTRGIFVEDRIYAITPKAIRSAIIDQIDQGVQTLYYLPQNIAACDNPAPIRGEHSNLVKPGYIIYFKYAVEFSSTLERLQHKYDIEIKDRREGFGCFSAIMSAKTMQQIRCEETISVIHYNGSISLPEPEDKPPLMFGD